MTRERDEAKRRNELAEKQVRENPETMAEVADIAALSKKLQQSNFKLLVTNLEDLKDLDAKAKDARVRELNEDKESRPRKLMRLLFERELAIRYRNTPPEQHTVSALVLKSLVQEFDWSGNADAICTHLANLAPLDATDGLSLLTLLVEARPHTSPPNRRRRGIFPKPFAASVRARAEDEWWIPGLTLPDEPGPVVPIEAPQAEIPGLLLDHEDPRGGEVPAIVQLIDHIEHTSNNSPYVVRLYLEFLLSIPRELRDGRLWEPPAFGWGPDARTRQQGA